MAPERSPSEHDIVASVAPRALASYLDARGWSLIGSGHVGSLWRLELGERTRNVAVPNPEADVEDRVAMLITALRTVSESEDRDLEAVVADIPELTNDLIEFRVTANRVVDGEIPLEAVPELTAGAREALQAAARSVVGPRPSFAAGTLPSAVRDFVREARFVGTAKGSVILKVRAPASPEDGQETFEGMPRPLTFGRRATQRLVDGVRTAKEAVHRDPTTLKAQLEDDIESGLSANLCDALEKLSGSQSQLEGTVSLRVKWAAEEPAEEPLTEVELEDTEIDHLSSVAATLREITPEPQFTVEGPVIRLEREPGAPVGVITIHAEIDLKVRPVKIEVALSDYELAYQAQSRELEIRAKGTLEHAGRSRALTDVTQIEIVEATGSDGPPPEPA